MVSSPPPHEAARLDVLRSFRPHNQTLPDALASRLAADKARFEAGATIFEQVQSLWLAGMLAGSPELQAARPHPLAIAGKRATHRQLAAAAWIAARTCWKVPQRHILVIATLMSASVGFGFSVSSAATAITIPLWQ